MNRNSNERIKFVEFLRNTLTSKYPFKTTECTEQWCPLCQKIDIVAKNEKENKISCRTNNIGYRWICDTCAKRNIVKIYEGESSRSARIRSKEHKAAYKNEKADSVLFKHKMSDHNDEKVKFKFEITDKFKYALTRQADESVRINMRAKSELLNSKNECNHQPIARICEFSNFFIEHQCSAHLGYEVIKPRCLNTSMYFCSSSLSGHVKGVITSAKSHWGRWYG